MFQGMTTVYGIVTRHLVSAGTASRPRTAPRFVSLSPGEAITLQFWLVCVAVGSFIQIILNGSNWYGDDPFSYEMIRVLRPLISCNRRRAYCQQPGQSSLCGCYWAIPNGKSQIKIFYISPPKVFVVFPTSREKNMALGSGWSFLMEHQQETPFFLHSHCYSNCL